MILQLFIQMLILIFTILLIFHTIKLIFEILHFIFIWVVLFPYYSIKGKDIKIGYKKATKLL